MVTGGSVRWMGMWSWCASPAVPASSVSVGSAVLVVV